MGSTSDKIKGYADQAAGSVKTGVGKAVGSDKMQVQGEGQKLKGQAEVAVGKAKDGIKDAANKAADTINKKL